MKHLLYAQSNFEIFLDLWNQEQKFITPCLHRTMARWLQKCWHNGDTQLLLMAFRASGKSTLVGLFLAWLLWQDQDLRILVLAADQPLASRMVRNIRKIIEKHPLTAHLIPTKIDQWASDRFTITRQKEQRDPSVLAAGINSNITGSRADIIIYDDVEVPNTCATPTKREQLREYITESNFILVPGGSQIFIGTPHSYFSIYADKPRKEIDEKESFLNAYKRLEIPILNKLGQSAWKEQFSKERIKQLRKQSGPNKFASQMLLQPVNIREGRLNSDLLNFYKAKIEYREVHRCVELLLNNQRLVSCHAWWDPAFGSAKGDNSVVAIVFTDEAGNYYLHHLEYISINTLIEKSEAEQQAEIVAKTLKEFYVPAVSIETNGIGKFLPSILKQALAKENFPCAVLEKTNNQNKEIRILEAFDAPLAARAIHVNETVAQTPFLTEMMEWQPSNKNNFDDGLDAVAGAILSEPVRVKRQYANGVNRSPLGGQSIIAKTDFNLEGI